MIKRYAVMGCPVQHSLSPRIHQAFAKQTGIQLQYDKILIDLERFEQQVVDFFNFGGKGLNITLPCKKRAFLLSDIQTVRCQQAGVANTLWMEDGQLHADNTDGIGLIQDVSRHIQLTKKRILIVGAGGAVCGVLGPLLNALPASITVTNRTMIRALELQQQYPPIQVCALSQLQGDYDLILNATSASSHDIAHFLPSEVLANASLCYDLAYSKDGLTPFVAYARSLGRDAIDGFGMLVEQAAQSFFMWHGIMPNVNVLVRNRS